MSIKYLSPSGLTEVWSNIKAYIASKIPSKIITGLSIKGRTITYTNSDGTTGTLTTQDTNTTYSVATTSTNGLMSSTDKTKLDGIAVGANNYTHPSSHPASMITGLTKVATSGSYNDLTNKPTIPTVNNATLTIQKNGTTVKTFTANSSTNVTANITVPTKTSELTNNSGFLTSHNPVDSSLSSTSTNAIQNKVVNAALNNKANNSDVVHKSGTETIVGTKTFSSQIKGNISGSSTNVVVGSDTATARGYLVDSKLPWYTWEEGSQLIAESKPLIIDFNNLTKPGVYHVIFCVNDGFIHEEKEYKESLNRPSIPPGSNSGFRDGILEIKRTTTMDTLSSYPRITQKLTLLSGSTAHKYINLTYQRVCINPADSKAWTAWARVARDEEVVHTSGDETINGVKTFSNDVKISKIAPYYNVFSTGYIKGQAPTSNMYSGVRFYDDINSGSTNGITGSFEIEYNTDGYNRTFISSRNYAEKTQKLYHVGLRVPNDNTRSIDFLPSVNGIVNLGASSHKWKAVYATTFNGNLVGNANTATKATQDAAGNVITTTYAKDANVVHKSGNETIAGLKTFSYWQIINMGLNVKWITGNKEQKSLFLFASMDDSYRGYGAELQLHTETLNGGFNLIAKDKTGTNLKFLSGDSNGSLTWDGKTVLTAGNGVTVDTVQTITGEKTFSKTVHVENLTNYPGHNLWVYAGDLNATYSKVNYRFDGTITINCVNTTTKKSSTMDLKPDGTFTWNGKHIVRTVNGVGANQAGNVNLTNILGFTPVQQGGGTGQLTNKIYIGWTGSQLKCTVDKTDLGAFVFEGRAQVGTTITAYYSNATTVTATGGNSINSGSGTGVYPFAYSDYINIAPTVGTIYTGSQLFSSFTPTASGTIDKNSTGPSSSLYQTNAKATATFSGAFSASAKYLCTTANAVKFRAYVSQGTSNAMGTASVVNNSSTKSIFIRVQ